MAIACRIKASRALTSTLETLLPAGMVCTLIGILMLAFVGSSPAILLAADLEGRLRQAKAAAGSQARDARGFRVEGRGTHAHHSPG